MKRAAIAYCADVPPKRFDVLETREQLPFATDKGRKSYSLEDAWLLRLTLDLIGGEDEGNGPEGGLPPSYVAGVVVNAIANGRGQGFHHPLSYTGPDFWFGVAIFEAGQGDNLYRFSQPFFGEISGLSHWIHKIATPESGETPVRVFVANASRAARFVRQRAHEMGLPEADTYREAML